jgi:hypothetical protein
MVIFILNKTVNNTISCLIYKYILIINVIICIENEKQLINKPSKIFAKNIYIFTHYHGRTDKHIFKLNLSSGSTHPCVQNVHYLLCVLFSIICRS